MVEMITTREQMTVADRFALRLCHVEQYANNDGFLGESAQLLNALCHAWPDLTFDLRVQRHQATQPDQLVFLLLASGPAAASVAHEVLATINDYLPQQVWQLLAEAEVAAAFVPFALRTDPLPPTLGHVAPTEPLLGKFALPKPTLAKLAQLNEIGNHPLFRAITPEEGQVIARLLADLDEQTDEADAWDAND
jgi:hypothetical protein